MLEYAFEKVSADRGFVVGKTLGHQEIIVRRAAEGWRYVSWIPTKQVNGAVMELELIFEREQGRQA